MKIQWRNKKGAMEEQKRGNGGTKKGQWRNKGNKEGV
jgi:hypothetical protein